MMKTAHPEALWFMTGRVTIHLAAADNADGLSILEHRLAHGFAPPRHVHLHEAETFHILEGRFRMERGEEVLEAGPGDTIHMPAAVPHCFRVVSAEGGRCLTFTRGGFENAVRQASRPALTDGLPDQAPPTPAIQAELARICAANGIESLLTDGLALRHPARC